MISADTNIFVYAADTRDALKQEIAQAIVPRLRSRGARIALQVIGEFQNIALRKLKIPQSMAAERASFLLDGFATFPASRSAARAALAEMASGRLSYWDALMLASAAEAGCTAMLSEDMQDGARIFGLEIVNPFGEAGVSARAAKLLELT